jgi:hypothetical protein
MEKIAVYSENHTKPINKLCGQNGKLVNVNPCDRLTHIVTTVLRVKLAFLSPMFISKHVLLYLRSLNSTRHELSKLPSLFFSFLIAEVATWYLQHNKVQHRGLYEMYVVIICTVDQKLKDMYKRPVKAAAVQ